MNKYIGTSQSMEVKEITESGFVLTKEEIEILLPKGNTARQDYEVGEQVTVFIYVGYQHEITATTNIPKVQVGRYSYGTVTEVKRQLGVFVDIGIEKDIVVSLDDLPELEHLWPKKGDRLMIALRVDEKDRIWGVLADEHQFKGISRKAEASLFNENVEGTVYRLLKIGSFILTTNYHIGFIHESERNSEPRLGEHVTARVIAVKPDGSLNLSLRGRAHEVLSDDAEMILTYLNSVGGEMAFGDKSSPESIRNKFGISKAQFKRAIGSLMKAKKVTQEDGIFTKLVEKDKDSD